MSLKSKIASIVGIIMLILLIITGIYSVQSVNSLMEKKEVEELDHLTQFIDDKIKSNTRTIRLSAINMANSKEVVEAFASRDRERLKKLTVPIYKLLEGDFSQGQFHLPNSVSFLRLHRPENYGDNLSTDRKTVNRANEEKKIVEGLEAGKSGFGIRSVVPISYEGKHIGTFEYGSDFKVEFLTDLKESHGGCYYIYKKDREGQIVEVLSTEEDKYRIEDSQDLARVFGGNKVIKGLKMKKIILF